MSGRGSLAGKRPATLTISAKLLDKAQNLKINLSRTREEHLLQLVRAKSLSIQHPAECFLRTEKKLLHLQENLCSMKALRRLFEKVF